MAATRSLPCIAVERCCIAVERYGMSFYLAVECCCKAGVRLYIVAERYCMAGCVSA